MGRSPCCDKTGLKKGPWTQEEDLKLTQYIRIHGPGNWRTLPENAGLQRCGKSCRLRWTNYLRPDIKRGRFSSDEEETIIQLHSVLGNKWSAIATHLPGRTDNEIKNYWNTHIRKQLIRNGIDPVTHTPRLDLADLSNILNSAQVNLSNLLSLQTLMNPEVLTLLALLASASSYQQNQESFLDDNLTTMNHNPNPHPQTCASMPLSLPSTELFDDQQNLMLVTDGQQFTGHIAVPNQRPSQESLTLPCPIDNSINVQNYNNPQYVAPVENLSFQTPNTVNKTPTRQNINIDSILQIPMSKFTHVISSSSSLATSSVSEDETGSHCRNMFTFEAPERFEFDEFM